MDLSGDDFLKQHENNDFEMQPQGQDILDMQLKKREQYKNSKKNKFYNNQPVYNNESGGMMNPYQSMPNLMVPQTYYNPNQQYNNPMAPVSYPSGYNQPIQPNVMNYYPNSQAINNI